MTVLRRRGLIAGLAGLLAAPAIVRAGMLMPIAPPRVEWSGYDVVTYTASGVVTVNTYNYASGRFEFRESFALPEQWIADMGADDAVTKWVTEGLPT